MNVNANDSHDIRNVILLTLHPHHFWVSDELRLVWQTPVWKEEPWELFRGNLLPVNQTRETVHFFTAGIYVATSSGLAEEPLVSIKWDETAGVIHVVRAILSHVWEGVETAANVIESRETTRWVRELVGTVDTNDAATAPDLIHELACLVFQAIVGTSRLPLTSLETPMPQFALGQLGYFFDPSFSSDNDVARVVDAWQHPQPMNTWQQLLQRMQHTSSSDGQAKALELCCRSLPESDVDAAAKYWKETYADKAHQIVALFRRMFNDVSLSPYTQFVDRALRLLHRLEQAHVITAEKRFDLLGYLLRWLCRHLTAYDLETFHYRGANYPDALLLDALLLEYCSVIHANADLIFARPDEDADLQKKKRRSRRAFRQACIIRRRYENHVVPDAPTSPGENARVLPEPYVRVSDEQILNVHKRSRRLYAGDDLIDYLNVGNNKAQADDSLPGILVQLLEQSIADLAIASECEELGKAVFIDRPLGVGKQSPEPDQTILFAYEAFSKNIAKQRLAELQRLANDLGIAWPSELAEAFDNLQVSGVPIQDVAVTQRPLASLADVARVSSDFVLTRTLPRGVREFYRCFDFDSFAVEQGDSIPGPDECTLIVPARYDGKPGLAIYDSNYDRCCALEIVLDQGYCKRGGIELPVGGLRVLQPKRAAGLIRAVFLRW